MKLRKMLKTPLIFTIIYDFVDAFYGLVPACNLLRYLMIYLVMFKFNVYNFASLVSLLTTKGRKHISVLKNS